MRIVYTRSALKSLSKAPRHKAEGILAGIEKVAKDPFAKDNTITALQGVPNGFRKRFGDWRVLYTVDTTIEILEVFKVGTRGDIYR